MFEAQFDQFLDYSRHTVILILTFSIIYKFAYTKVI